MTRVASHAVLSLELGRHVVPISWGNATFVQDEPEPGVYGLESWALDAELADFDLLEPIEYEVRAELDNGEVLEGREFLSAANGWHIQLQSTGAWTGTAGWQT